jgi:hypothetical protein
VPAVLRNRRHKPFAIKDYQGKVWHGKTAAAHIKKDARRRLFLLLDLGA